MDRIDRMPLSLRALSASPFVLALGGVIAGCPAPGLTCPEGYVPAGDHCALGTDGGPGSDSGVAPDAGTMGDGSVTPDMGTDAFVPDMGTDMGPPDMGTDACGWAAFYPDMDGDGHGDATAMPTMACAAPTGFVSSNDDCNDMSGTVNMGACNTGHAETCVTTCGSMGTGACDATCMVPTGTACSAPMETCNAVDDDCDGLLDEQLMSVTAAVATMSGTPRVSPRIVALTSGYGVLSTTNNASASTNQFYWQTIDAMGTTPSTPMSVGTDAGAVAIAGIDARFDGTNVFVLYQPNLTSLRLIGFEPVHVGRTVGGASGGWVVPLPANAAVTAHRIVDATSGVVTIYAMTTAPALVRVRVNTAGVTPTVVSSVTITTDVRTTGFGEVFDVAVANGIEYLVYQNGSGSITARTVPSTITTASALPVAAGTHATPAAVTSLAVALRNATVAVSATNPLAVAYSTGPSAGVHFVQFTNIGPTALVEGADVALPTSRGIGSLTDAAPAIRVLPAPYAAATPGTPAPHFYVAAMDSNLTSGQSLVVWETTQEPPTARALTVPMEGRNARAGVSIAAQGLGIRLATQDDTNTIITRGIGCP